MSNLDGAVENSTEDSECRDEMLAGPANAPHSVQPLRRSSEDASSAPPISRTVWHKHQRQPSSSSTRSASSLLPGPDELQRSSSLARMQQNSLRVVATPFTSSRYHRFSVERRLDVGNHPGCQPLLGGGTIARRLEEVKRLVDAGIVKQSVYDQLVGVNKKEAVTSKPSELQIRDASTDTPSRQNRNVSKEIAEKKSDKSRLEDIGLESVNKPNDYKESGDAENLSTHSRAKTAPVGLGTGGPINNTNTEHQQHRSSRSIGTMLSRLLSGINFSRNSARAEIQKDSKIVSMSPLDVQVVAPAMLNYKVVISHAEKAADLKGNLFTRFVASVEYGDKAIKESWVVRRRYQAFHDLNREIREVLSGSPLIKAVPKFPGKHGLSSYLAGEKFLIQRQERLDAWLEGVICLSTRNAQCAKLIQFFLHAPDVEYLNDDDEDASEMSLNTVNESQNNMTQGTSMTLSRNRKVESFRQLVILKHKENGDTITESRSGFNHAPTDNTARATKLKRPSQPESASMNYIPSSTLIQRVGGGLEPLIEEAHENGDEGRYSSLIDAEISDNSLPVPLLSLPESPRHDMESPVPDIPARPMSLRSESLGSTKLESSTKTKSMINIAKTAASRVSLELEKRRTILEPERKIVKGPEGYHYEWRQDIAPVQNFMWKRGGFRGGNKNWKRRWIVLKKTSIFYYRTSKPKLLGTVPLDVSSSVVFLDDVACPSDVPQNCFAFVVKTESRHLYIYTDDETVREQWAHAVHEQVNKMSSVEKKMEVARKEIVKRGRVEPPPQINIIATRPPVVTSEKYKPVDLVEDSKPEGKYQNTQKHGHVQRRAHPNTDALEEKSATIRSNISLAVTSPAPTRSLPVPSVSQNSMEGSNTFHSAETIAPDQGLSTFSARRHPSAERKRRESERSHWELDKDHVVLGKELGKGAFGVVYHGTLWGTDVAIKKLYSESFSIDTHSEIRSRGGNGSDGNESYNIFESGKQKKQLLADLKNEVRILSQLRHPNVVLYMGVCTKIPDVFIVTELCPRRSLFEVIHDPSIALSCELRLRMALQAAQGMAYLHSQPARIIHRDLKSHNLLVGENFDVKVADFGLTVVRGNKPSPRNNVNQDVHSLRLDTGGHYGIHGTPQWMAPEVMEGSPYNGKVDVYSYGVVLCEVFSRMLPFSDRYHAFEFIEAVLEQGATPTIPRWCFSGRGSAIRAIGLQQGNQSWQDAGDISDSDDENIRTIRKPLDLPQGIQTLRRGTLRKIVLQCLDRDPKQRPSFDGIVELLRDVLMPVGDAEGSFSTNLGARVFLEFDIPRIVETMRRSAILLEAPPSSRIKRSTQSIFSSHLLHGAAVCREVDDLFSAMSQARRGLPTCSDDHRYMSIQPPALSLRHAMARPVCLLLSRHMVHLLDAVTSWVSRNGVIAASYEPVSVLWDVLGAIEALVRMQDPFMNRAHQRAMNHPLQRRYNLTRKKRQKTENLMRVKTHGVINALRDAGIVASIIALFALLPSADSNLLRTGDGSEEEEMNHVEESYVEESPQTDDEMLRDHLCRAADLGE